MIDDGAPTDWNALEAQIDALLALDAAARASRLDAIERDDPFLAMKLRDWLAQIDASEHFLASHVTRSLQPGERLGPWRLLAPVGRGGMGEVWRGERADGAFARTVAIKLLRRDRPGVALQLARERELLAKLRHPGIAQLLDGGLSHDAQPYLVTEWVDGHTLDAWLRRQPRTLAQRIDLLRRIADAVAYAHANLIVHRDLKPANVMVDADGAPRLLDFGIARFIDATLQRAETADRALTPGFAAPEQVTGAAFTTRTDVHGLGALLYWLLTERAPHAGDGDSLARWVARLSSDTLAAPSQLAARRTAFAIDADLDAIALVALARDPAQRYASADAFAQDLARWQRGDAVSARLPTRRERARRFVRRHRGGVAAAALIAIAILAGVLATRAQEQAALREAARATAVKDFLLQLFTAIKPEAAKGEPVLVDTLVAQGERDLPTKLASQPQVQHEMLSLLAQVRLSLGQPEPRLKNLEALCPIAVTAYGTDSAQHVDCLNEIADAYRALGRLDDAHTALDQALAAARRLQPRDPLPLTTTLRVQFMLQRDRGDNTAAEASLREAIDIARAAEHGMGEKTSFILEDLAVFLPSVGRRDEAMPLLDEIVAFDQAHPAVRPTDSQINSRWNLLTAVWAAEQFERTVTESETMAAFTEAKVGRNHPLWYRFMQLRAIAQGRLGRYLEAVDTLRSALATPGIDGWEHGRYRQMLGVELANTLPAAGAWRETQTLAGEMLALADREGLSAGLSFVAAHAAMVAALQEHDAAHIAQWSIEVQRRFDALPEPEKPGRGKALRQLRATQQRVAGDSAAAARELADVATVFRTADGRATLMTERALAERGFALAEAGDSTAAARQLREIRSSFAQRFGEGHVAVAQIDVALARLPDATPDERARAEPAAARFHAATWRAIDTLRML